MVCSRHLRPRQVRHQPCIECLLTLCLDTGIYTAHNCFGGRASWGATFGGYANADGNGWVHLQFGPGIYFLQFYRHGTFMAGAAVCHLSLFPEMLHAFE